MDLLINQKSEFLSEASLDYFKLFILEIGDSAYVHA